MTAILRPVSATQQPQGAHYVDAPQKQHEHKHEMPSYLRRLAKLIAQIYTTFSQISQNDRKEITRIEQKYTISVIGQADKLRGKGNLVLGTAIASLLIFTVSLGFQNTKDSTFVGLVSQKIPDLSKLYELGYDADINSKQSMSQLEIQKLQDKTNRSQSDGNIKEQFAQVLQAEIQRLRSASSSNN